MESNLLLHLTPVRMNKIKKHKQVLMLASTWIKGSNPSLLVGSHHGGKRVRGCGYWCAHIERRGEQRDQTVWIIYKESWAEKFRVADKVC